MVDSTVSLVIIGRNEGPRLGRCLESASRIDYPAELIEVIYVDSGSTDGSVDFALRTGARVVRLDRAPHTAARARNAGWRVARGTIIFFLDGDTIVDRIFLRAALSDFEDPCIAAVFGNRRELAPEASIYNRVLDYDWLSPSGLADYCGGDVLMRRTALAEVGGYREDLIAGEEPELCARFRQRSMCILHRDIPMTLHDLAMRRWTQYWRRSLRTGYAYAEISTLLRDTSTPLWLNESRKNFVQGAAYLTLTLFAILCALLTRSVLPLAPAAALFFVLIARTTMRNRTRVPVLAYRICYAVHSHLQQVPIFLGQIGYRKARLTGRGKPLIEYHYAAR